MAAQNIDFVFGETGFGRIRNTYTHEIVRQLVFYKPIMGKGVIRRYAMFLVRDPQPPKPVSSPGQRVTK